MKNILYSLLALIFLGNTAIAQLMSDDNHKNMLSTFRTNANTVLSAECPQGVTIEQFKRNIATGANTLSTTAQNSLVTYAAPLKSYAQQFASQNNLVADNDAQLYFFSSFPPSTLIQDGKLVDSNSAAGITAETMWSCALSNFNTEDCGISAVLSDKNDIKLLATAATTFLTEFAGNTGVLVMIGGFGDCISHYYDLEKAGFAMSGDAAFVNLVAELTNFNNLTVVNQENIDRLVDQDTLTTEDLNALAISFGFQNKAEMDYAQCLMKEYLDSLNSNYLKLSLPENDIIFNAATRYFRGGVLLDSPTISGARLRNLGITMFLGSCANLSTKIPLGRKEQIGCTVDFMRSMCLNLPFSDCVHIFYGAAKNAIVPSSGYSAGDFLLDLAGCAGDLFGVSAEIKALWNLGNYVGCMINAR